MILDDFIEIFRFVDDIPGRKGASFKEITPGFFPSPEFMENFAQRDDWEKTWRDRSEIEIGFLVPVHYGFGFRMDLVKDLSVGWRYAETEKLIPTPDLNYGYLFCPTFKDRIEFYGYYKDQLYKENIEKSKQKLYYKYFRDFNIVVSKSDLIEVYRFVDDIPGKTGDIFKDPDYLYYCEVMFQPEDKKQIEVSFLIDKRFKVGDKNPSPISYVGWKNLWGMELGENLADRYLVYPSLTSYFGLYKYGQLRIPVGDMKVKILDTIQKKHDYIDIV